MFRTTWAVAAALALLTVGSSTQAEEPFAAADVDAPVVQLNGDQDSDTQLVHWWGRGCYGGYYGGYGGYYGGWGGYGPYYGYSYYRPYYGGYYGYGYYPRYSYYSYYPSYSYGYGYGCGYYPRYYGSYYYGGYCGISGSDEGVTTNLLGQLPEVPAVPQTTTPAAPAEGFRYDGGPSNPVPLPNQQPTPAPQPQPKAAPQQSTGLLVSLPGQPQDFTYRAFGETAPAQPASNFAFPAYGESGRSDFATQR